ncbi:MAG: hypothetical protein IIB25_09710, partial [Chloroflexi bacterium]|nr:hypothetical protein [Chloroflexota bacterium]
MRSRRGIIESAIRRDVGRLEPLGNHCGILSGYAFKSVDFVPDGVRLLRNKNVQPDHIDWTDQVALEPDQAKEYERFRLSDGAPVRAPVCRGLRTYPLQDREGKLFLNVERPGGAGMRQPVTLALRVVSNENVSTFIKELVLEATNATSPLAFTPGDYIQVNIPDYGTIAFDGFDVPEPYASVWRAHHVFDL